MSGKTLPLSFALGLLLSSPAGGQGLPENEFGEPWNGVGAGVRAMGMGGAYTALSDDLAGIYWNPAGLVRMRDTQAGFMTGSPYLKRDVKNVARDLGMVGFATTAFKPWVAGLSVVRNFHSESLVPWQEDYYIFTFVVPNAARTGALGLNVKYLRSDDLYGDPRNLDPSFDHTEFLTDKGHLFDSFRKVRGWALDIGVHYDIPLHVRDRQRQANFGVNLRNALGSSRVLNRERALPPEIQAGFAWIFDDLIPRERSIVSLNYDVALSARLGGESTQYRLGFEQWFYRNMGAIRLGFAAPFPIYKEKEVAAGYFFQGRPIITLGATIRGDNPALRTILGLGVGALAESTQVDMAVTMPAGKLASQRMEGVPENQAIYLNDPKGILVSDETRAYLQVTWHWESVQAPPYANVKVEPLVFAPKKAEVAVFTMEASDKRGLESWELMVHNSARVPVRSFGGKGAPPGRLVWDGLDGRFNLVPDDDHTYRLKVRNRDGVETVTAAQSLRVFTPGEGPGPGDPSMIYRVLEDTAKKEDAGKAAMEPLIDGQLQDMKTPLGDEFLPSGTAYGEGWPSYPVGPSATALEISGASATRHESFAGLERGQVTRFDIAGSGTGGQTVLEYGTEQTVFKFLIREMRRLTEQSYRATGPGSGGFLVRAQYGSRTVEAETPGDVARGLVEGRVDEKRWLRAARFRMDGKDIEPVLD